MLRVLNREAEEGGQRLPSLEKGAIDTPPFSCKTGSIGF